MDEARRLAEKLFKDYFDMLDALGPIPMNRMAHIEKNAAIISDAIALAQAAAFEAAAMTAEDYDAMQIDEFTRRHGVNDLPEAIRTLTPADVRAAQERHDAKVRLELMDEVGCALADYEIETGRHFPLWEKFITIRNREIAKQRIAEGGQ